MNIEKRNQLLSIVFGIIILVLGYMLYHAIVDPYKQVLERQQVTEQVRHKMSTVKDALVQYKNRKGGFPPTEGGLDSLVQFLKSDSLMAETRDSLFLSLQKNPFNPDSLVFSPRPPHKRFEYALNDSTRPEIYVLRDPDTEDRIGSLERTTYLNAPSWE